jgi:hypothetical protein
MILLGPEHQLPAPDLREVVADTVPPLGLTKGAPDYTGIPKRVLRSDIYPEAMKELGVQVNVAEEQKITLFDGVFDGKIRRSTPRPSRSTQSLD